MNAPQPRVRHFDLAGGILILWVMVFHAMSTNKAFGAVDPRVALPFLTFSMPWFFYKSGKFFKVLEWRQGVKKDFQKFLIPFLKWSAIGYAIYLTMQLIDGTFTWVNCVKEPLHTFYIYGYIPINVPAWFLLSLLFVRVFARLLIRWKINPIVCIVGGIAIGYSLHLLENPLPFYFPNIAMGIAYFMIGYRFGQFENKKYLFIPCLAGYLAFMLFGTSIVGHHRNILLSGHYLLWPLFAYCGIVTFNNLCRWIDAFLSRTSFRGFRLISFIGEHTMTLFVAHALIYMPVSHYSTLSPWQTVDLTCIGYVLFFTPLLWWKKKRYSA